MFRKDKERKYIKERNRKDFHKFVIMQNNKTITQQNNTKHFETFPFAHCFTFIYRISFILHFKPLL